MTSSAPNTQGSDMRHMYDFIDLRNNNPHICPYKNNTIMGVIGNNSDFTIFKKIVEKASFSSKIIRNTI